MSVVRMSLRTPFDRNSPTLANASIRADLTLPPFRSSGHIYWFLSGCLPPFAHTDGRCHLDEYCPRRCPRIGECGSQLSVVQDCSQQAARVVYGDRLRRDGGEDDRGAGAACSRDRLHARQPCCLHWCVLRHVCRGHYNGSDSVATSGFASRFFLNRKLAPVTGADACVSCASHADPPGRTA